MKVKRLPCLQAAGPMTRAELLKPFLASFESKRPRVQRPSAGGAEGRFCVGQGHRDPPSSLTPRIGHANLAAVGWVRWFPGRPFL